MVSKESEPETKKSDGSTDNAARREIEKRKEEAKKLELARLEVQKCEAIEKEREAREARIEKQTFVEPITLKTSDGAHVTKDMLGRVCETMDARGIVRKFDYNPMGELKSFSDNNGAIWSSDDGLHWNSPNQKSRAMRAVVNAEDGTFGIVEAKSKTEAITTLSFINGNTLKKTASGTEIYDKNDVLIDSIKGGATNLDGDRNKSVTDTNDTRSLNANNSGVKKDSRDRIAEVTYKDGSKTQFDYDDSNHLVGFTDRSGCHQIESSPFKAHVDSNGTFSYQQKDGTVITKGLDGRESRHDLNTIDSTAKDIQTALANADLKKIEDILVEMPAADHKLLEQRYLELNNRSLRDDLKENVGDDQVSYTKLSVLLNRSTDLSDEIGQFKIDMAIVNKSNADANEDLTGVTVSSVVDEIYHAFAGGVGPGPMSVYTAGQDWQRSSDAQQDIMQTVGLLGPTELAGFKNDFKQQMGQSIEEYLANSPMSKDTKEALSVYLNKGRDERTTDDDLKLAKLAIDNKDLPLLKTVMLLSHNREELSAKITEVGYRNNIATAFKDDQLVQALDYVDQGGLSVLTKIKNHDHILHTDRVEVERLVKNASDTDRVRYERGEHLSANPQELDQNNANDKQALAFYNDTRAELTRLSSSPAELIKWESELEKKESVLADLANAANDPKRMYAAVENLSEKDWQQLRDHPEDLKRVADLLNHTNVSYVSTGEGGAIETTERDIASEQDTKKLMDMLNAKINSSDATFTYQQSQRVGKRSISEIFATEDVSEHDKLNALKNTTDDERKAIKDNVNGVRDQLATQLEKLGLGHDIGKTLLAEIDADKKPTAWDQVMLNVLADSLHEPDTDPVPSLAKIHDWEAAFAENPALLQKIANHGNYSVEPFEYTYFASQFGPLLRAHNIDNGSEKYYEFMNQIFKTGKLDLSHSLVLADKQEGCLNEFNRASEAEKALLKQTNPTDADAIAFQKSAFKDDNEKILVQSILNNTDGKMSLADKLFAYTKCGAYNEVDSLQETLSALSKDARQAVAAEYFQKYHQLLSTNLADKLPEDKRFIFKSLLSGTDFNVRQFRMDTTLDNDNHRSYFDGFLGKVWNAGKMDVNESANQLTDWIKKNPEAMKNLTPEDREKFMQAVKNYQDASQNYIKDKKQFAEQFTDAAITVAVMGSGLFTGFSSTAAYYSLLATAAVAGGTFKLVATKRIEGTDFDNSEKNVINLMFRGGSQSVLGLIGPEFGLSRVGPQIAEKSVAEAIESLGPQFAEALTPEARKLMSSELSDLSRQVALGRGEKFKEIAEKVLVNGTPEQQQLLQQALQKQVSSQVTADLRANLQKKVLYELESASHSAVIGSAASAAPVLGASVLGLESPEDLWERMKQAGVAGAEGALFFHVTFKGAGSVSALLRKGDNGLIAGKDTVVHRNGQNIVVKDELVLQPEDRIVEDPARIETARQEQNPNRKESNEIPKNEKDTNAKVTEVVKPYVVLSDGTKVDPVTAKTMEKLQLTPDSYVYRSMDPQYLDLKTSTVSGNPKSIADIADPYNMVELFPGQGLPDIKTEAMTTTRKVGPGLNVSVEKSSVYEEGDHVLVKIKLGDLLKQNGKIYLDSGAANTGIKPLYITFDGSVPFERVPVEKVVPPVNPQMNERSSTKIESKPVKPEINFTPLKTPIESSLDETVTSFRTVAKNELGGNQIPENAKYIRVGRKDITLTPDGPTVPIGREDVGSLYVSSISAANPNGHVQVGLTSEAKPYLTADPERAQNTFVMRKGTKEWVKLSDLSKDATNNGVVINYGDQVRLGGQGGANLDLSELTQANFKVGNTNITLRPGERKSLGREDIDPNDQSISRKHLSVGLDDSGRTYIYEDPISPSSFGTYVKRQGADQFVRVVPGAEVHVFPGDEVRLGTADLDGNNNVIPNSSKPGRLLDMSDMYREVNDATTPELSRWGKIKKAVIGGETVDSANSIVRTKDGGLQYRDGRGLVEESSKGSKVITDYSGAKITEEAGRITKMTDAHGSSYRIEYGSDGEISKVWFGDTPYERSNTKKWTVEKDGSLHLVTTQAEGGRTEVYYHPDGTMEVGSAANGQAVRFNTKNIDIKAEEFRISQLAESQIQPEELGRFKGMLQELKQSNLTEEQQGEVLHQLNRMLADDSGAVLKSSERAVLAEQALQQTLHPEYIDQGQRPMCALAALEKKVAFEHPGEYLRVIADASISGKYVTSDGKVVDVNLLGSLKIDDEALKGAGLSRGLPSPVKQVGDSNRSWSSQIFQEVAINSLVQERPGNYIYQNRGTHEALIDLNNIDGGTVYLKRGRFLEMQHSPHITDAEDVETMFTKLTGKSDDFWLTANISDAGKAPVILNNTEIGYEEGLARVLMDMQANGKHAIAVVDVRNSPFWETSGSGAAGGAGGAGNRGSNPRLHAVMVKDIDVQYIQKTDGSYVLDNKGNRIIDFQRTRVTVLNSWGRKADHVAANQVTGTDTRLSVKQLYAAMNGWSPNQ
jgi:hypothetical protein